MDASQTSTLRRFNRSYTQRIGALDDSFLGMGFPLGAIRLLYEIGAQPGTVQTLRARLGIDSGYISRQLRMLEGNGLIDVKPDRDDKRRRVVSLTRKGRSRWNELERRSDIRAQQLLEPLTERQRERLSAALAEADLLIRSSTVSFEIVDPTSPEAVDAVMAYFSELHDRFGFDSTGLDAKDAETLRPPNGVFVLSTSDAATIACGGVQTIEENVGEIKRMWVDNAWRGSGIGSRLLRHLENESRNLGHHTVRLDSNETLTEAIAMYERAGYVRIARYNDNPFATHFFEKALE